MIIISALQTRHICSCELLDSKCGNKIAQILCRCGHDLGRMRASLQRGTQRDESLPEMCQKLHVHRRNPAIYGWVEPVSRQESTLNHSARVYGSSAGLRKCLDPFDSTKGNSWSVSSNSLLKIALISLVFDLFNLFHPSRCSQVQSRSCGA